ncbi:hypothetical protein PENTCL1PPCAC_22179, partial [Pristionchus entomophagus]
MSNCQSNKILPSFASIASEMELFGFALDRMKPSRVSSNSSVSPHERPDYIDCPRLEAVFVLVEHLTYH